MTKNNKNKISKQQQEKPLNASIESNLMMKYKERFKGQKADEIYRELRSEGKNHKVCIDIIMKVKKDGK